MALHNLACEQSVTTGTSNAVLSGAVEGCNTFDLAGVANAESVNYVITTYSLTTHRPTHREVGTGTYTTATKTVARTTVVSSTNAGAKIVMTGLSDVAILPQASEIGGGGGGSGSQYASYYYNTSNTVNNAVNNQVVEIDTELVDANNLASVASNTVTFAGSGDYMITANVTVYGGAAFNGSITVKMNTTWTVAYKAIGYATADNIADDLFNLSIFSRITGGDTVTLTISNQSGATRTYGLSDLTIVKLG